VPKLIGRKVNCPRCGEKMLVTEPTNEVLTEEEPVGVASEIHTEHMVADDRSAPPRLQTSRSAPAEPEFAPAEYVPEEEAALPFATTTAPFAKTASASASPRNGSKPSRSGSGGSYDDAKARNERKNFWFQIYVGGGVSTAISIVVILIALYLKGYWPFNRAGKNWRQDGSRFADFASQIDVEKQWNPQAPTNFASKVERDLTTYRAAHPSNTRIQSIQQEFQRLQRQHQSGSLGNAAYQQQLNNLNTRLHSVILELEGRSAED